MFPATFRRLQVFLAVVEAGSFVHGARKLGISRPSVSQHISALERDAGFLLFDQPGRGAVGAGLTPQGRKAYETGVDVLERVEQFSQDLAGRASRSARDRRRQQLRVAAHRFILSGPLKTPLADFTRDHPDVELILEVGSYTEVITKLRDGTPISVSSSRRVRKSKSRPKSSAPSASVSTWRRRIRWRGA